MELLSRGKIFEEKYQALPADTDVTQRETDEVYNLLREKFPEIMDVLLDFSEKLRQIIWSMTDEEKYFQRAIRKISGRMCMSVNSAGSKPFLNLKAAYLAEQESGESASV